MQATLPRSILSGLRSAAFGKRLAMGLVALALIAGAAALAHILVQRDALQRKLMAGSPQSQAQRLAHCTEGALLFHDVRWAVMCKALADKGEGDGHAECELPDEQSARLYALLQQAEQRCQADAS